MPACCRKNVDGTSSEKSSELKHLQDSLTRFFTPTNRRRSRVAQSSFSLESFELRSSSRAASSKSADSKKDSSKERNRSGSRLVKRFPKRDVRKNATFGGSSKDSTGSIHQLSSITVDTKYGDTQPALSVQPSTSSLKSGQSTPSPHRRADVLHDALTPYFSTASEKRRTFSKGQYVHLSGGRTQAKSGESITTCGEGTLISSCARRPQTSRVSTLSESHDDFPPNQHRWEKKRMPITTNESAKLCLNNSSSICGQVKEFTPERHSSQFPVKSCSETLGLRRLPLGSSNKLKTSIPKPFVSPRRLRTASIIRKAKSHKTRLKMRQSLSSRVVTRKHVMSLRQPHLEELNMTGEAIPLVQPVKITDEDREMYALAKNRARLKIEAEYGEMGEQSTSANASNITRNPKAIRIGNFEVETWYSAPYPAEYAQLPVLYLCEFCMKYMRSSEMMQRHAERCQLRHPPGTEIYRKDDISIFEVDGHHSRVYCQNICLLAKLFLEHKTLYYDVEPFFFYVVTKNDSSGCHFVGYFSKEKYGPQIYNLSCIMTLPSYQRQGFGRFLIDFSFLLTRKAGLTGTPERPLSDLGQISFSSYWRSALCEYLYKTVVPDKTKRLTLRGVARGTGISVHDVIGTLRLLNLLERTKNQFTFVLNMTLLKHEWVKARNDPKRIQLDETKLLWSPTIHKLPAREFQERPRRITHPLFSGSIRQAVKLNRAIMRNVNVHMQSPITCNEFFRGKSARNGRTCSRKLILDSDTSDEERNQIIICSNTCRDATQNRHIWRKTSGDDDSGADVKVQKNMRRNRRQAETSRNKILKKNVTNQRFRKSGSKKAVAHEPYICLFSDSETSDLSDGSQSVRKNGVTHRRRHRRYMSHSRFRRKEKRKVDNVESIELNSVSEQSYAETSAKVSMKMMPLISKRRRPRHFHISSSSDLSGSEGSSDDSRVILKRRKNSAATKPLCSSSGNSPVPLGDQISPELSLSIDPEKKIMNSDKTIATEEQLSRKDEKNLELSVDNEDELPPTLEADGAAKNLPDQSESLFDSRDRHKKEWDNSERLHESGNSILNGMPLLRVNIVGNECIYDGEDEDAPPRLSPNFALVEDSNADSPKELESIPNLSQTALSKFVPDVSSPSKLLDTLTCVSNKSTPAITTSVANNICEMVNLGGDAGSEGESEAEQKEPGSCHPNIKRTEKAEVLPLRPEASALDRPPKAPAMLSLPNEEHELGHLDEKGGTASVEKDSSGETVEQTIFQSSNCRQSSSILNQSPILPPSSIHSDLSSQGFISPPCSLQKRNTSDGSSRTPLSQIEASPGEIFIGSAERNNVCSNPSTPHHLPPQAHPGPDMFCITTTDNMRLNMIPKTPVATYTAKAMVKVSTPDVSLGTAAQQHSSRRSSKKNQNRSTKSTLSNQRVQMLMPSASLPPYVMAPGPGQSFMNPSQATHSQTGPYYANSYVNSRHPTYFDPQFHPSPLSTATASAAYPATNVNYPTHLGSIGKTHPVGAAVQSGFSYSYPRGMHQTGTNMALTSGNGTVGSVTPQQMIGVQCSDLQHSNQSNAAASWRYPNPSAAFSGNFMDAFGGGVPSAANGSQFALPNQLYYQHGYHPYLMPMMRND